MAYIRLDDPEVRKYMKAKAKQLSQYMVDAVMENENLDDLTLELAEDIYATHRSDDWTWDEEADDDLSRVEAELQGLAMRLTATALLNTLLQERTEGLETKPVP